MDSLTLHSNLLKSSLHHGPHHPVALCYSRAVVVRASVSVQEPQTLNASALDLQVTRQQHPPFIATATTTTVTDSPLRPLLNDPSLRSTWAHRAWVACGFTSVLATLGKSGFAAAADHHGSLLECLLASALGYLVADLGTGVYHWAIDNYGDVKTPFFGAQIEAFEGHHRWPWTITRREFANNLSVLARGTTFFLFPVNLLPGEAGLHAFAGTFVGCLMFSQQFHAWAHGTKSRLPPVVVALQDAGLLVSRAMHAAHHRPPYNNNYCIVSGVWNQLLDEVKFFELLEMVIFFRFGVRPRSWSEPNLEWTEEVGHGLPS